MADSSYIGTELETFAHAINWKRYCVAKIVPLIGDNVLEVGAGLGETTIRLCKRPCRSWLCLEPDSDFCETIKAKITSGELPAVCSVYKGTTDSLQANAPLFDTILYIDVLEHLQDDCAELKRASNLLDEHGLLIVIAPAHAFLFSPFDTQIGHLRRYNTRLIKRACPEELTIERVEYLDSVGMLASLANRWLIRNPTPTLRQIEFWDRIMVPISKVIDPLLFNSVGKTVLAVFRKRSAGVSGFSAGALWS